MISEEMTGLTRQEQLWMEGNQTQMHKKQIMKVGQLIKNTNELLVHNSEAQNLQVSKYMLGEKIRSEHMVEVSNELQYLKEIPLEYLRVYFDQIKIDMEQASENELQSKEHYERSRHDPILWRILEERRKARNARMAKDVLAMKQKLLVPFSQMD